MRLARELGVAHGGDLRRLQHLHLHVGQTQVHRGGHCILRVRRLHEGLHHLEHLQREVQAGRVGATLDRQQLAELQQRRSGRDRGAQHFEPTQRGPDVAGPLAALHQVDGGVDELPDAGIGLQQRVVIAGLHAQVHRQRIEIVEQLHVGVDQAVPGADGERHAAAEQVAEQRIERLRLAGVHAGDGAAQVERRRAPVGGRHRLGGKVARRQEERRRRAQDHRAHGGGVDARTGQGERRGRRCFPHAALDRRCTKVLSEIGICAVDAGQLRGVAAGGQMPGTGQRGEVGGLLVFALVVVDEAEVDQPEQDHHQRQASPDVDQDRAALAPVRGSGRESGRHGQSRTMALELSALGIQVPVPPMPGMLISGNRRVPSVLP